MVSAYVRMQQNNGVTDKDPLFWLPHKEPAHPTTYDQVKWLHEALEVSFAFPPAGEKWNAFSMRGGAVTAAHSVGVSIGRMMHVAGVKTNGRRDLEKLVDAEAEPTATADFFFGRYRSTHRGGGHLSEDQRRILADDTIGKTLVKTARGPGDS